MTPRERFLTALKCGVPDMVPVAPDLSNMIPARLTGKPFWDIYLYNDPPLYQAYLEALKKFKHDGGWEAGPWLGRSKDDVREYRTEIISKDEEKIVVRHYISTPEGELWRETIYWRDMPPTSSRELIKDFEKDMKIYLKYFFPDASSCDDKEFRRWKEQISDNGVAALSISFPGFQDLICIVDGGLEKITYYYYDYPEIFEEYVDVCTNAVINATERIVKAKPDLILIGASGTLTLSSPQIFRKLGLPALKKITKIAKESGIPTLLHSCGKEKELVKICVEETDLNGINPLERPPMGDCDLKELKILYGNRICLMGNLHTTDVMLKGRVEDVVKEVKKLIQDAGANGGFILSTGDQTPRDTPLENIHAMVETARAFGKY